MTSSRTAHTRNTAESWLSRELRERIARIGIALAQEAENVRDQEDREPQIDGEAER
jgi:flagellar biosynthesis regulator FlaF